MSKLRLLLEGRSGDTANRWSVELYSFLVQDSAASQCPPAINIPTRWLPKWKNLFCDFLKKTPNRVSALHFSGSVNFKSWKALGILVKVHFISSQKNFWGPLLRMVVIRHTLSGSDSGGRALRWDQERAVGLWYGCVLQSWLPAPPYRCTARMCAWIWNPTPE